MPNAPRRPCPRCRRLVYGDCLRCARARDRARGSARVRGYDRAWASYSRAWLRRYPWCGQRLGGTFHAEHSRCWQRGERIRAQVTDHIQSLRSGGAMFDPFNHQSLCIACNTAKDAPRARFRGQFPGGFEGARGRGPSEV